MAATIQSSFGLDINPLKAASNQAIGVVGNMTRGIGSHISDFIRSPLTQLGGAIASYFTYENFKSGIEGVIEAGNQMVKLHEQTGMTTNSLAMLKAMSAETDVDFESLAASVNKMQRGLFTAASAGGPVAMAMRQIGLDMNTLLKMKPEDQFTAIGEAIAKISSPVGRSAIAMTIFGRAGAELLPLFESMGTADFGNLRAQADVLGGSAEQLHQISVQFKQAKINLQSGFIGLTAAVAPLLDALSHTLSQQSALSWGKAMGDQVKGIAAFWISVWQNPQAALAGFVNLMREYGADFNNLVVNGLIKGVQVFGYRLELAGRALAPIGDLLGGAAVKMGGFLIEQFGNANTYLQSGLEFAFQKALEGFDAGIRPIVNFISAGLEYAVEKMKEAIGKIPFLGNKAGLKGFQASSFEDIVASKKAAGGKGFTAQTFEQILNRNQASAGITKFGQDVKGLGSSMIASAMKGIDGIGDAFDKFKKNAADVFESADQDFFGAAAYRKKATDALNAMQAGINSAMAAFDPKKTAGAAKNNPFARFSGFTTVGTPGSSLASGGLGNSGGLTNAGGLAAGAYGQTPLLSVSERRAAEDAAVAQGGQRQASTSGAYHATLSGDRARAREAERQKLKDQTGVDKTNQHLSNMYNLLYSALGDNGS